MWNKPQLMTAISDLLFVAAAAALLVAAVLWGVRLPLFPRRWPQRLSIPACPSR